ncbi:hypothetical protein BGZ63DRAFT_188190 [Mariannaea sp. PMI_226]|nr:hypothetical protein BGZ63DRAFT_188190 [Mariannaea sp. PMI_226]
MISLQTLLNPAPADRDGMQSFRPSPASSSPIAFSPNADMSLPVLDFPCIPPMRTTRDSKDLEKTRLRGPVTYPPFETLNDRALYQMSRFQILSFGHIGQSVSHIPYNSGKKDFYEKTGRESFEVFRYKFTAPGQTTDYTIMWDYNVGLVRMTPFFKCCQYGKTVPAKMLNLNPGLKAITHSITGGSISAQGYWMPYKCAKAVCATFCYHIAGALIPLFGPDFPSECVPPESPEFGRMVIDPQLVIEATHEAEMLRRKQMNMIATSVPFPRSDPMGAPTPYGSIDTPEESRRQHRPRLICNLPWTDENRDAHYPSVPNSASSTGSGHLGYIATSRPSSSWEHNHHSPQYDLHTETTPYLTSVPTMPSIPRSSVPDPFWNHKRRLDYEDGDFAYRSSTSPMMKTITSVPVTLTKSPESTATSDTKEEGRHEIDVEAATVLVSLGVRHEPRRPRVAVDSPSTAPATALRLPEPWHRNEYRRKRPRMDSS